MMASIKTHSIAGVKAALENNEFPLHFNHRDELLDLIDDASAEFLESLESTAALREDAKISYITIISLRENVRNWYAP